MEEEKEVSAGLNSRLQKLPMQSRIPQLPGPCGKVLSGGRRSWGVEGKEGASSGEEHKVFDHLGQTTLSRAIRRMISESSSYLHLSGIQK